MIFQRRKLAFLTLTAALLFLPQKAVGDYVVTLKSGRKITVHSYRVESSHTRLYTLEGEIVLPKEQIIEIKVFSVPAPQETKEEPPLPAPKKSPLYMPEEKPSEAEEKGAPG